MDLLLYFFIFLFGTFIGSFLGVIIYRLPRGESIVRGRSHCDHCKKTLTALDLIPLFSFFFLRGKCRHCGARLSWFYPLVEIVTGTLFVLTVLLVQDNFQFSLANFQVQIDLLFHLFIISCLIIIFFIDLKHSIIPFSIIFPAIIISLLYILFVESNVLGNHFFAGLGAFLFFLLLFLITRGRGMGFGDVVYVFFMGLLLGFPQIVVGLYIAFVSGAVVSLILVGLKLKKLKGGIIPFGPFLVLGTLITLFWGQAIISSFERYFMY